VRETYNFSDLKSNALSRYWSERGRTI